MIPLIKKIILWMNNHPQLCSLLALTACIPVGILSIVSGWKIMSVIFGVLGFLAAVVWLLIIGAVIGALLDALWKRIVNWAEK